MSTRRSKRKPLNQSQAESDEMTVHKKTRKKTTCQSTDKNDEPFDDSTGRSTGRRSARKKQTAVSYKETENSDDGDFEDAQDDSEYTASSCDEQDRAPCMVNGSTRGKKPKKKMPTMVKDEKLDSADDSDPGDSIKKEVFEASKLQAEINLSSDDDSEDEHIAFADAKAGGPSDPCSRLGKGAEYNKSTDDVSEEENGERLPKEIDLSSNEDNSSGRRKVGKKLKKERKPDGPVQSNDTNLTEKNAHGTRRGGKVDIASESDISSIHLNTDVATTSSPYFYSKKHARDDTSNDVAKQSQSGYSPVVTTLSGKLKQKRSLFDDDGDERMDNDDREERWKHQESSPVKKLKGKPSSKVSGCSVVSKENLLGDSGDGDGKDRLSARKERKAAVQAGGAAIEVTEATRKSQKRPRRACRKSPVKTVKKTKASNDKTSGTEQKTERSSASDPPSRGAEGRTKKSRKCRVDLAKEEKLPVNKVATPDKDVKKRGPAQVASGDGASESSDDDEWEDVEDIHIDGSGSPRKKTEVEPSTAVVEIDIELPGAERKRKKEYDWADHYRRELNKVRKERQVEIHKVHLLCLLANGFHRNTVCNDDLLLSTALSIIPPDVAKARPKNLNMNFVYKLLFWYRKHFGINTSLPQLYKFPVYKLLQGMQSGVFSSEEEFVMVFVLCIRALWGDARLVISFQPITWKAEIIEKNGKIKKIKLSSPKSVSAKTASTSKASPKESKETLKPVSAVKTVETTGPNSTKGSSKSGHKSHSKAVRGSSAKTTAKDVGKRDVRMRPARKEVVPKKRGKDMRDSDGVTSKDGQELPEVGGSKGQRSARKGTARSEVTRSDSVKAKRVGEDEGADRVGYKASRYHSGVSRGRQSTKVPAGESNPSEENNTANPRGRATKGQKEAAAKSVSSRSRNGQVRGGRGVKGAEDKMEQDEAAERDGPSRQLRKRVAQKTPPSRRKVQSSDDEGEDDTASDEGSNYSEEEWIHQKKASRRKRKSVSTPSTSKVSPGAGVSSDSDFEEEIENLSMNKSPPVGKRTKEKKLNSSILSSDSEESVKCNKQIKAGGVDVWCEVFLPALNMWVSVDCMQGYVNKPHDLESRATQPLLYVVGFDNNNSAKDITQRYATRWMSHNIKLRIEEDWWQQTISAYKSKKKKRDKDEDAKMQSHHLDQPLPKSIVEYKNHPLYALERHLLKFEAIYPPSAAVLGYCKGEPVYSRECVHTLKSSLTWMKEAKAIKDGEKPYKFVKKLINPFKRHVLTPEEQNQMLDVYGEWQTEPYIPPPAKDGIIPRNEYGNVELFQPSMLPKGTVHLKIPGLNKVASKLDIDCAPAMMGWEFHKRFACPILEGFVVCEEVADVLVAAWQEEQVEMEKKKQLKREQKAMKNWKHLIKSLLIREKLKEKYQLEEEPPSEGAEAAKGKGKAKKTKAHWPQNKMTSFKGDTSNLLPFEKKSENT